MEVSKEAMALIGIVAWVVVVGLAAWVVFWQRGQKALLRKEQQPKVQERDPPTRWTSKLDATPREHIFRREGETFRQFKRRYTDYKINERFDSSRINDRYASDGSRAVLVNEIGVPDTCLECKGMSNACLFTLIRSTSCAMKNAPMQFGETPMKRMRAPDGRPVTVPTKGAGDYQASPSLRPHGSGGDDIIGSFDGKALAMAPPQDTRAADLIVETLQHCCNDYRDHGHDAGELTKSQLKWITKQIIDALNREGFAIGEYK